MIDGFEGGARMFTIEAGAMVCTDLNEGFDGQVLALVQPTCNAVTSTKSTPQSGPRNSCLVVEFTCAASTCGLLAPFDEWCCPYQIGWDTGYVGEMKDFASAVLDGTQPGQLIRLRGFLVLAV